MKERTARRLAWAILAVALALYVGMVAGAIWLSAEGARAVLDAEALLLVAFSLAVVVGVLVASRRPENPIGWLFLANGLGAAALFASDAYARYALVLRPGALPAAEWAAWVSEWMWGLMLSIPFVFIPLLFPDGKLPSRRWRPFAWFASVFLAFALLTFMLAPYRYLGATNPIGIPALRPLGDLIDGPGFIMLFLLGLISMSSLVVRFRSSGQEQRQQIKWVIFGAGLLVFWFGLGALTDALGATWPAWLEIPALTAAFGAIPAAAGVAILKHRLLDIDVVINRTVLYGVLAALVTAIYVGIVVGIGTLVGSENDLFLSILATAVVAVGFQPLRERARRLADRVVYGKRATPYELLSEFADRLEGAYSVEDILPRMARLVGEGTGAARARVWLRVGSRVRPAAAWPAGEGDPEAVETEEEELPALPDADAAFPVRDRGELLGALTVVLRRGDALTPTQEKLLQDLAGQAGLILRNARLIEELRASRQRLVAAQDEERRRLERNIHDGAQQQLVALAVQLNLAKARAAEESPAVAEMLEAIRAESQEALETLRDLARGIYPPLLADRGLAAALEAQGRKAAMPVTVEPDGVGRYPQEAEAAAYFCVLEALQNAAKYAEASSVQVRLRQQDGHLVFEVADDGRGFDPRTTPRGSGLQNMSDRLEALGGSVTVSSSPGGGTTVIGRIPVEAAS